MRTGKIILIATLMVLLASSVFVQDAFAEQKNVTINNKSDETVIVVFELIRDYKWWEEVESFSIKAVGGDKVTEKLEADFYKVKYTHCGIDFDFEILLEDAYTLVLYPCQNQPTKLQVKSHLSEEVVLNIYGYKDYEVDILPGLKTRVEVYSGNTDYEYEACGGQTFFGELQVKKNGTTQLVLHSCEWHTDPVRTYARPNPVKFRIINHASFSIIMQLIGPQSDIVTINPGVNVITLISGTYKFSYYQDNKLVTGSMLVTPNGLGVLVVSPSYVMEYVEEFDDLE
jgi:hypothetical protein